MDPNIVAQYLVSGLMLAMIYALLAVGFTLFFGVLDIVHFAHGDVFMVGAFVALMSFISFIPTRETNTKSTNLVRITSSHCCYKTRV